MWIIWCRDDEKIWCCYDLAAGNPLLTRPPAYPPPPRHRRYTLLSLHHPPPCAPLSLPQQPYNARNLRFVVLIGSQWRQFQRLRIYAANTALIILSLPPSPGFGRVMWITSNPTLDRSSRQWRSVRSNPPSVIIPISRRDSNNEVPLFGRTASRIITLERPGFMPRMVCSRIVRHALSGQSWKICRKK